MTREVGAKCFCKKWVPISILFKITQTKIDSFSSVNFKISNTPDVTARVLGDDFSRYVLEMG